MAALPRSFLSCLRRPKISLAISLAGASALPGFAASAPKAAPSGKGAAAPSAELSPVAEKIVLWKQFYLSSVNGVAKGYFEEVAERRVKEKQIAISQNWVEAEGGRTETFIGSVAADDDKLTPVAFFSERTGAGANYKLDGRAKGNELSMTYRSTKPAGPAALKKNTIARGTILANFLPLYLSKLDPAKGAVRFSTVVEDARDGNFDTRAGTALLQNVKKEIGGQSCRKARVEFNGQIGEWWIASDGRLCEFFLPEIKAKLSLTTEEAAKKAVP